jgi:hypothetical protein
VQVGQRKRPDGAANFTGGGGETMARWCDGSNPVGRRGHEVEEREEGQWIARVRAHEEG